MRYVYKTITVARNEKMNHDKMHICVDIVTLTFSIDLWKINQQGVNNYSAKIWKQPISSLDVNTACCMTPVRVITYIQQEAQSADPRQCIISPMALSVTLRRAWNSPAQTTQNIMTYS